MIRIKTFPLSDSPFETFIQLPLSKTWIQYSTKFKWNWITVFLVLGICRSKPQVLLFIPAYDFPGIRSWYLVGLLILCDLQLDKQRKVFIYYLEKAPTFFLSYAACLLWIPLISEYFIPNIWNRKLASSSRHKILTHDKMIRAEFWLL